MARCVKVYHHSCYRRPHKTNKGLDSAVHDKKQYQYKKPLAWSSGLGVTPFSCAGRRRWRVIKPYMGSATSSRRYDLKPSTLTDNNILLLGLVEVGIVMRHKLHAFLERFAPGHSSMFV
jgi:hypothetical protein